MISEKCGTCSSDTDMKEIDSTNNIILLGCGYCGNVKDYGIRFEDQLYQNYTKDGEPEHFNL